MVTQLLMPQLGESVVEGIVVRWLKGVGDQVGKYEPLVEIMTDKVNVEVPSPVAGTVSKILVGEGEKVRVGTVLALLEGVTPVEVGEEGEMAPAPEAEKAVPEASEEIKARASPLVKRLAQEHGVDISKVKGTGIGGRVTKEDILNYIAQRAAPPEARPVAEGVAARKEEVLPLTPLRRLIAEHMVRSKHTSPHATTMMEVDMTSIVRFREGIKEEFRRKEGVDLTYLPFVIKATVQTLKEIPILNSSWTEEGIILKKEINIGMAVAIDDGLVVPVIHGADGKSIQALARAVSELASRSRAGKLSLEDVQGGTFTVNNTGAFGSVLSVPIINQPQAAILSMEAIVKRPVVIDDAIAIRSMMYLCLSFDHRVIDGAIAGRFLQGIKRWLESFSSAVPIY